MAFHSDATDLVPGDTNGEACSLPPCLDVFVRDLKLGATARVSVGPGGRQADGSSFSASVSTGGRVAFSSDATNLVPGDTNGAEDVFVRRRAP